MSGVSSLDYRLSEFKLLPIVQKNIDCCKKAVFDILRWKVDWNGSHANQQHMWQLLDHTLNF